MREYVKHNNSLSENKLNLSVVSSLPVSASSDDIVLLENKGMYQYINNQWVSILNLVGSTEGIIGEIKYSLVAQSDDWLLCDGCVYDTDDYPQLYSVLGDNHVPDLRELVLVGAGYNTTDNIAEHENICFRCIHQMSYQAHSHTTCITTHCHTTTFQKSHTHTIRYSKCCNCNSNLSSCNYGVFCTSSTLYMIAGTTTAKTCIRCIDGQNTYSENMGDVFRTNTFGVNYYIRAR